MKKLTAYEKACKLLKRKPATIKDFTHETPDDRKMCFGEHKYRTCIKAANLDEKGKPINFDWKNWSQPKFRIWMEANKTNKRPSGVGFSFYYSNYSTTYTFVGSRLHSKTSEIAREIATNKEIVDYFNEWMGV